MIFSGKDEPGRADEVSGETILTACGGCDLLLDVPAIPDGHNVTCRRCGTTVKKTTRNSVDRVLALSIAGLTLYIPAIFMPLMKLSTIGISVSGNVIETAVSFIHSGYFLVAVTVLMTAVIFPLVKLLLSFLTALQIKLGKRPPWLKGSFRLLAHLDEWGMIEVYLLGILVSLIKIYGMASIHFDVGFFSFIGLVIISIAASSNTDKDLFWQYISDYDDQSERVRDLEFIKTTDATKSGGEITAAQCGLMRCHDCGILVDDETLHRHDEGCPRCGSSVHERKPNTISRTWALVLTSLVLVLPANILPIMEVSFLGIPDRSTIMDGIIYFFKEGSYGIGLIIFLASILVPLFKILGLIIMLLTIRFRRARFLRQKTKMFRFIEFIGRWSMLDIFVIALMTVLVDFGFFTSVKTAPGATFFCLVVFCTMLAAIVFDPRTMWDRCTPEHPTPRFPTRDYER